MPSHRSKWGWWLVAALVAVLAASFLYRRCTPAPPAQTEASAPAGSSAGESTLPECPASSAPVVRDTMIVEVDGGKVPVVRERIVEEREPVAGTAAAAEEVAEAEAPATQASTETVVVTISVKDLSDLVRGKSGQALSLSTRAPDRIIVTYSGKVDVPMLGEQGMDLSAGFRVVEVEGDRLVLQLDSGTAMNLAADVLAPLVLERLPAGLVESFSSGRAVINLSAVPQLRNRLSGFSLKGISVDDSNIRLTVEEK